MAVLSITHFNKTGANNTTKAMHRFIGSIAFTGAPRAAFAVIEDADNKGRMLFLHAKNNLAAAPQGLAYRLEQTIVAENIVASRVAWENEPVAITANQALAADAAGSDKTARQEADEFLRGALANGPVPAKDVQRMASEHGISPKTLRTARETMGVKVSRDGFGPGSKSLWSAPYLPKTPIDPRQNEWASMDPEGKYGEPEPAGDLSIPEFLKRETTVPEPKKEQAKQPSDENSIGPDYERWVTYRRKKEQQLDEVAFETSPTKINNLGCVLYRLLDLDTEDARSEWGNRRFLTEEEIKRLQSIDRKRPLLGEYREARLIEQKVIERRKQKWNEQKSVK